MSKLHFFRDSHGNDVDLLIQRGAQLIPVEIQGRKNLVGVLKAIKRLSKTRSDFVVYNGDQQGTVEGTRI